MGTLKHSCLDEVTRALVLARNSHSLNSRHDMLSKGLSPHTAKDFVQRTWRCSGSVVKRMIKSLPNDFQIKSLFELCQLRRSELFDNSFLHTRKEKVLTIVSGRMTNNSILMESFASDRFIDLSDPAGVRETHRKHRGNNCNLLNQSEDRHSNLGRRRSDSMDVCEHIKSSSHHRLPPRTSVSSKDDVDPNGHGQMLEDSVELSSDWIDSSWERSQDLSSSSCGRDISTGEGTKAFGDKRTRSISRGRGRDLVSILSKTLRPKADDVTDEDMTSSDDMHASSLSSYSGESLGVTVAEGSRRFLLQKVDSIRMAAANRREAKRTALEESLMQQLADMQTLHDDAIREMEVKLHQREAAIKTLERALSLRNEAVEEVRDELDLTRAKLKEAEHTIRKQEKKLARKARSPSPDKGLRSRRRSNDTANQQNNDNGYDHLCFQTSLERGFNSRGHQRHSSVGRNQDFDQDRPQQSGNDGNSHPRQSNGSLLRRQVDSQEHVDFESRVSLTSDRRTMMGSRSSSRRSLVSDPTRPLSRSTSGTPTYAVHDHSRR